MIEQNLESARQNEKKDGPKIALFCFIAGALLGFNAYELLAEGRGIVPAFMDAQLGGILSALISAGLFFGCIYFIYSSIINRKKGVTEKRVAQFMKNLQAFGPEDEVLARIEGITPVLCEEGELRYDEALITGTSAKSVDFNFIYPISALCTAGILSTGSEPGFYLHAVYGGRKHKHSSKAPETKCEMILQDLERLRPGLKIQRAKPAKR